MKPMITLVPDRGDVRRLVSALHKLERTIDEPEDMRQEVVNQVAYPAVMDIFDNEGYGAWEALSPRYAAWKSAVFGELPILERTGNLRASLTLPNGPDGINQFTSDGSLAIGSSLPYFGAVNEIRPIAQFTDEHLENMKAAVATHVGKVAADEGFEVFES